MAENTSSARTYQPRKPRKQAAGAGQMPLMAQVQERAAEVAEQASEPVKLSEAIQLFAQGVGMVEALARMGEAELTMQLARIAYTRARQAEREANGERQ